MAAIRSGVLTGLVVAAGIFVSAIVATATIEPTVPKPKGYVSDYVGVLDANTVRELDNLIGELKEKTGAEIAVVVVGTTKPLSAFDYAMKIAEAWKPGRREKDNGVVFLAALDDRELFILTGYGVEGVLPDGRVGEIRDRTIVPAFRRGDFRAGLREGTWALASAIAADTGVNLSGQAPAPRPALRVSSRAQLVLLLLVVAVILLQVWLGPGVVRWGSVRHRRGFGGGFGGGGFGGGGFGGGGFGGFGGGGFGGGGAGGRW